jgi:hypothetical protein
VVNPVKLAFSIMSTQSRTQVEENVYIVPLLRSSFHTEPLGDCGKELVHFGHESKIIQASKTLDVKNE